MSSILVLDLGTTYFKFSRFDGDGHLCDTVSLAPPLRTPLPGRLELEAEDFSRVLVEGIGRLRQRAGEVDWAKLELVSFATQTNSFVLLDAGGRPLTPIVLWPDRRAADLDAELRQRCAVPGFTSTTGVPEVNPCFMIAKLLWLQRRRPEAWQSMRKVCLISDYLTWLLTGQHATEAGAAALTALVDLAGRRWWPEMLNRVGLDERCLPGVLPAGSDLGLIRPAAAGKFGLPPACRFILGCLDQYAGAIGSGNVVPGRVSETTGTVLATVALAEGRVEDLGPSVFQGPAFANGRYWRMAFGDVAANYLEAYRNSLPDRPDFETLSAAAGEVPPGADGLRLNTDGPPGDPSRFFAGRTPPSRGHAVRSIFEAVAVALRGQVRSLCRGALPTQIRSAGGAARSGLWLQIKADVLGAPFRGSQCPEPTSLGAAILAEAARSGAAVPDIAERRVRLGDPHRPHPENRRRYQAIFPILAEHPNADVPSA